MSECKRCHRKDVLVGPTNPRIDVAGVCLGCADAIVKDWLLEPDNQMKFAAQQSADSIQESLAFLLMWDGKTVTHTLPLIQMGLAVYMNKPIRCLIPKGFEDKIPDNLRRLAERIEFYEYGNLADMEAATKRLCADIV